MPKSVRREAMIDAPVEEVWELVGDPRRHPEWFPTVVSVDGLEDVHQDVRYRQVSKGIGGEIETTFAIEEFDDLRQIGLRCTDTGMYCRWHLTPAQDGTFTDIEMGFEPRTPMVRIIDMTVAKRYLRRWTDQALEGLQGAVSRGERPSDAPAPPPPSSP